MAIQIIVSFGHAHRIEGFRQGALLPQATTGIHSQLSVEQLSVEPGGSTPKPIGLVFDYCAICVVINMGASMMPASAPASGVPVNVSKVQFSPRTEAAAWTLGHLLFHARAPPFA
jgi:hypothetical protein